MALSAETHRADETPTRSRGHGMAQAEGRPQDPGAPAGHRTCVVVMGVAGVGKTTVAQLLAERLGLPFADADDFHPAANIAKMSAGIALDDEDRRPWLDAIGAWLRAHDKAGTGGVVTCSALKRGYRDLLRTASPGTFFLHLSGERDTIGHRIEQRTGHFMPPALLDSQYAALEPLGADEAGTVRDVGPSPEVIVEQSLEVLPASVRGDRV